MLKTRVLAFQGCVLTSRTADPVKDKPAASDSDSGLTAANKVIKLTSVAPPNAAETRPYGGRWAGTCRKVQRKQN
jgi:hypothetical protein